MWGNMQAQVTLKFQPAIHNKMTLLGEVVVITPSNDQLHHLLLDQKLLTHSVLTQKQLIAWLETKTTTEQYEWHGKTTALVKSAPQISSADLVKKAQTELQALLKKRDYERLELIPKTTPSDSIGSLSSFKVKIRETYPPLKRICVHLYNETHSIPIWFEVRAYQTVLVAQKNLSPHMVVNADDFRTQSKNIAGLPHSPLTQLPQDNLWLKKSLVKNHIITTDHISPKPDVLKNTKVHLRIITQGIMITTEATAEEDGYVGQSVVLHNAHSKKRFHALITAPNQAEVRT